VTAQRMLRLIGRLYQLEAGWDDAAVGDACVAAGTLCPAD
jgi:hypothetical protein